MAKAETQWSPIKIDKLISRIEDGDIKVPAFQRGFAWSQEQVVELLDSIYNNSPIGSILLWNSTSHLKAPRNVAGFQLPDRTTQWIVR